MAYAFEQEVPIGEDVYRRIVERLGAAPLPGLIVHVVTRAGEGRLRYVDVWESEEACDRAFAERIHPAVNSVLRDIGFRPDGEPGRRELSLVEVAGAFRSAGLAVRLS